MKTHRTTLSVAALSGLSLSACGGADAPHAAVSEAPQKITALAACTTLNGKTIAGATLVAVTVAASASVPIYCKVNGTIGASLNFEIRLPDDWNGKLHYGCGGGYNGSIGKVPLALTLFIPFDAGVWGLLFEVALCGTP